MRALIIAVNTTGTRFLAQAESERVFGFKSEQAVHLKRGDQVKGDFERLGLMTMVSFGNQPIVAEVVIVDQPLEVGLKWIGLISPSTIAQ